MGGRGLFMDDEKDSSGVCPLRYSFDRGPPRPGKKTELSQSLAVRCGAWRAYAKSADSNPDSDHRGLGQLEKI